MLIGKEGKQVIEGEGENDRLGMYTETVMLGRNLENRESMIERQLIAVQAILKFLA